MGSSAMPPPQETYHANQFLAPKPSPKLLAEMERRGYALQPPGVGDAVLVTLPPGTGDAWDVQRELESKFPDQRFGLNYIYKPYHPQQGTGSRTGPRDGIPLSDRRGPSGRCTEEVCYGRKLIDWRPTLGACAADLKIGLIDTLVDGTHPAFAKTKLEIVNLALKNDGPPAPHWHATGVLSVLAGDEKRNIPSLIPRAEFTAINVFFTNKNGELETDTAHLTEALAYLDGKVDVPIINMSLVGPKDDLVHRRITDMATGRGVLFVAAAGNGGPGAPAGYPAAYDEVIAVTAVDSKGGNYDHANRGDYIDLAAPGVQILTSLPGGKEGFSTGTSFATPFVTAVVAAAYRDAKIGPAGRDGLFNPKRFMLAQLLGKEGLKKRDPILGYGLIKAPSACGSQNQPWLSIVKATPAPSMPVASAPLARSPAASIAIDTWRPVVEQASLPSEAAR
jgi:subtilisin family serine protease